jgi:NTP pyrophosphatase (non-canonical NTP hydrolase)
MIGDGERDVFMDIRAFQGLIEEIYLEKDRARGLDADFRWFVEEVGELARAMRSGQREQLNEEFADVLAWLSTMASICGIDLAEATTKYAEGCPKCGGIPCRCG